MNKKAFTLIELLVVALNQAPETRGSPYLTSTDSTLIKV